MRFLVLIAMLLPLAAARSQVLPAAATVVPRDGRTHAWFVGPDDGEPPYAVYHLPPRGGSGPLATGEGVLAIAGRLKEPPGAIAASGAGVIMIFPPGVGGERRVLTITATRGFGDTWEYDSQGRLAALPSLPGAGTLAGAAGLERGAAALIVSGAAAQLLVLGGDAWGEAPLPPGWAAAQQPEGTPLLVTLPGAVGLLDLRASPSLWTGTVDTGATPPTIAWSAGPLPIGAGPRPRGPVLWSAGRLAYAVRTGDELAVWQLEGGRALRLAALPAAGVALAFTTIGDRLAVISAREVGVLKSPPGEPPRPSIRYHVTELSALTGRVLYDGGPVGKGPLSAVELRVLAVGLLLVMGMILVLVLRPESARAPLALPPGLALAEGSRRWTATLIDAALALILGSKLAGVPLVSAAGSLIVLADPGGEGGVLLLWVLGVALGHGTIAECLFGRTLGKWLTACGVVRARIARGPDGTLAPRVGRAALWRTLMRNVVKWGLPPVAMAGLNSGDRRHRGDVLAGTAVVVEVEDPAATE